MAPDTPIDRETIETIIESATWAPNHHLTEPWRFDVMTGDGRRRLGEAMSAALSASAAGISQERLDVERNKPLSAPAIIALINSPKIGPNAVPREEIIAAGAALQNMLLAAHSLGLGSMVRTGLHVYSPEIRNFFQLQEHETIVGLVYLGYIVEPPPEGKRGTISGKVEWRDG